MPRLTLVLAAIVLLLGAGLAYVLVRPAGTSLDEAAVRTLVSDMLAERGSASLPQSTPQIDQATLDPMIERYLLANPRILQRVSEALDGEIRTAAAAATRATLQSMHPLIYEDPDHIVLGNPAGDVTLVELFDYNCGYCRQALPDLATLLAEDPNLKVILKEFPILSKESVDAARVGILVGKSDADYWTFHERLFTSRGPVTGDAALAVAQDLGLNRIDLALEMSTPSVTAVLDKSYTLARALGISGTPTYMIGDELIPGAVSIDDLRSRIANMRACGKTNCGKAG